MSDKKIDASAHQQAPTPNDEKPVWDLVIKDMQSRDAEGVRRYKTRLQCFNGRNSLLDAYQESLDQSVYMRQAIEERAEMVRVLKIYAIHDRAEGFHNSPAEVLLIRLGEWDEEGGE